MEKQQRKPRSQGPGGHRAYDAKHQTRQVVPVRCRHPRHAGVPPSLGPRVARAPTHAETPYPPLVACGRLAHAFAAVAALAYRHRGVLDPFGGWCRAVRFCEFWCLGHFVASKCCRATFWMHGVSWHIRAAYVTRVQAAGETVRTARSARGNTGTRAGPNGETGEKCASLTSGSTHCTGKPRGSGWDSGRTKLPNPRAPPMPSDAD